MPNEEEALQNRVRSLMDGAGMNQTQLAEAIGISKPKMSLSLGGDRHFSTYELAAIAEQFHTTVDYLLSGKQPPTPALAARDDSHESPAWEVAVKRAETLDETEAALNDLGIAQVISPLTNWERPTLSGLAIADGPALAEAARALLADDFRADMPGAIEAAFGIHVTAKTFGPGFDGLSWRSGDCRIIVINTDAAWSRQRFTLAHELEHHLAGDVDTEGLLVDRDVMSTRHRIPEMRANAFAAALLMPEQEIRERAKDAVTPTLFASLVGEFLVSSDALAWRLKNLGLVDDAERGRLARMSAAEAAREGGWEDRYFELVKHQSRQRLPEALVERSLRAFVAGDISAQWPARVLGCDADLLHEALDGAASEVAEDKEPVFTP
ncbi:XRE family transcriptional regulator [Streptomyces scabiei]|uniref:XRE family transcriptional regulator n=1 Tax=Streptomyces niveiscabiei TaxID=164115 RepID=A0ABW9HZ03_9ACTN|nr:XRE family transcriptional regulator [Streptomyces europaeiscabiei]MDX3866459.1 XRE family transcriptional regulator [Streptomyces europaeiscabiei]MDX3874454.1 XRE family transcriptional regulator [Streptomyces europaeiscabiei]